MTHPDTDQDAQKKKKIFISYDFKNDKELKNEIVGKSQHKDAPFKIANWSMKEDVTNPKWVKEAKFRITRCDILLVLVGENTFQSRGVLKEVAIARAAKMKVIQLQAHASYPAVEHAGPCHEWTWENLVKLLD